MSITTLWNRIEDISLFPEEVWFTRQKDDEDWKPLRKIDCKALNSRQSRFQVLIEGGRATADVLNGIVTSNFYKSPPRQLTSATWFVREEGKEAALSPIEPEDAVIVESFYQRLIKKISKLENKDLELLNEEGLTLQSDPSYKVIVSKSADGSLSLKKKPKSWFGNKTYDLQRGYVEYKVEGEEEEVNLGPVRHVIFVIHGVGQALINREEVKMQNLTEETDETRRTIQKLQISQWKKDCEAAKKANEPEPAPPNRIEILPIEWWDKIHDSSSSSSLKSSLKKTTIPNIPGLRAIANEVVFDVLTYMTPTYCESVLECVTRQINHIYRSYLKTHPDFIEGGGKFSLIGHSLGSVIVWDLLSILKGEEIVAKAAAKKAEEAAVRAKENENKKRSSFFNLAKGKDGNTTATKNSSTKDSPPWGPSLPKPMTEMIPFEPEFSMFFGSPLGMFLSLRGANTAFDEMLQESVLKVRAEAAEAAAKAAKVAAKEAEEAAKEAALRAKENENKRGLSLFNLTKGKDGDNEKRRGSAKKGKTKIDEFELPITSPFTLPSGSIYNIFHPYDPVAYRIEPLLLSQSNEVKPPPALYVTKKGQNIRFHLQAKQFGDGIVNAFQTQQNSINNFFSSFKKEKEEEGGNYFSYDNVKQGPLNFALGGKNSRVDYCIQPGVIENEYLSAVTAHSCYFINQELLCFIIDIIEKSNISEQE